MTSNLRITPGPGVFGLAALVLLIGTATLAQQAPPGAPAAPAAAGSNITLTAATANVSGAGSPVKINILRWSTDEERNQFVTALTPPARGAAPAPAAPPAGGGGGGRGGRGGAPAAPADPITTLTAAIGKAPSVGYLWTTAGLGYSIRYAYRTPMPDGSERIILATDPRLGTFNPAEWKLAAPATPTDYAFTIVELRLDPKGLGEGKTSLTTKVIVDAEAKTIALENYAAAPAVLRNVKR